MKRVVRLLSLETIGASAPVRAAPGRMRAAMQTRADRPSRSRD